MKALIILGTLTVGAILNTIAVAALGLRPGKIILIICIPCMLIASKLAKMWDERQAKKNSERLPEPNPDYYSETISTFAVSDEPSAPSINETELVTPISNITNDVSTEEHIEMNRDTRLKTTFENAHKDAYRKAAIDPNETDLPIILNNKASKKWITATICLLVVVLVLSGLNIYQYLNGTALYNELNATIQQKDEDIARQRSDNFDLREMLYTFQKNAYPYERIIKSAKSGILGYASNNFRSSKCIITLKPHQQNIYFTLTADFSKNVRIDHKYIEGSPMIAFVSMDEKNNSKSRKVTVNALRTGTVVLQFSNNLNTERFDVIIIVE